MEEGVGYIGVGATFVGESRYTLDGFQLIGKCARIHHLKE